MSENRIAVLEAALEEALGLARSLDGVVDQEFRVHGDPPCEDEAVIERLQAVLEDRSR